MSDTLGDRRKTDDDHTKTANRPFRNICVYISYIFAELIYNLLNVVLAGNESQNFQFNVFDVGWLVVLHEEMLIFIFEEDVSSA